jgi:hypothetical protein
MPVLAAVWPRSWTRSLVSRCTRLPSLQEPLKFAFPSGNPLLVVNTQRLFTHRPRPLPEMFSLLSVFLKAGEASQSRQTFGGLQGRWDWRVFDKRKHLVTEGFGSRIQPLRHI